MVTREINKSRTTEYLLSIHKKVSGINKLSETGEAYHGTWASYRQCHERENYDGEDEKEERSPFLHGGLSALAMSLSSLASVTKEKKKEAKQTQFVFKAAPWTTSAGDESDRPGKEIRTIEQARDKQRKKPDSIQYPALRTIYIRRSGLPMSAILWPDT